MPPLYRSGKKRMGKAVQRKDVQQKDELLLLRRKFVVRFRAKIRGKPQQPRFQCIAHAPQHFRASLAQTLFRGFRDRVQHSLRMLPQGRRRSQQPGIRSIFQPRLVKLDGLVVRFPQLLHPDFFLGFTLRFPLLQQRPQFRLQMHTRLLHAQHHALVNRLLIFQQRAFAAKLHVRARFFQRLARNLLEPLQRIGGHAMHLVRKSGRGHLRRLAYLVALASHNLFRGLVNLRRAVLYIRAAIMIQLRSQQTGNFRRPVAQRGRRLFDHLLHRTLHRAVRFFLVPLRSLQQRLVSRVLRLSAALLDLFFDFRSSFPNRPLDIRRYFFGFRAQPRHRFLYCQLRSVNGLLAHRIVQTVGMVRRLLHLFEDRILQLRYALGSFAHLRLHAVLQLAHALGRLPRLFVELALRVRRLLLGLLEFRRRPLRVIQPRHQLLLQLDHRAIQNLLRRFLQRRLDLLHPVGDYVVRLAAHFLLLRGQQLIKLLPRLAQSVLRSFLQLRPGLFSAMAFLLQTRTQCFNR